MTKSSKNWHDSCGVFPSFSPPFYAYFKIDSRLNTKPYATSIDNENYFTKNMHKARTVKIDKKLSTVFLMLSIIKDLRVSFNRLNFIICLSSEDSWAYFCCVHRVQEQLNCTLTL